MDYELNLFKSDSFIMESLRAMAVDQPVRDRSTYVDAVLEATKVNPNSGKLINNLYKEIQNGANIDYGKIPDSKGDLTKYKYYSQMTKCMEILNNLAKQSNTHNGAVINTMNTFHNILLDARDDFVFGYKFNVDIIKYTYQINVLVLYEVINACITEVAEGLKNANTFSSKMKPVITKSNSYVTAANNFIKSYQNGQWSQFMTTYRKNSSNLLGLGSGTALTAFIPTIMGSTAGVVIVSIIGILLLVRGGIYLFYSTKTKISDYAKVQSELIKKNIEIDSDQSSNAVDKQKEMSEFLDGVSAFLEGNRAKKEKAAQKAIKQSNAENFSKEELTEFNGADFEFV